ncbi:MAG TPA: aldehyde dehydrogenase [Rhodospirillaceae bacterium]|nr:aldehyde dehydrogenase [Rhodospirillaceae bacterium]
MDKQRADNYELHRREVAKTLLKDRDDDFLVVTGLGSPNWDATNAGDHPLTFPLWGAMGGAATMGLGLATAQPTKRVMVMTGDGEMLMALGSFATIAAQGVENLAIVVFDNERYGETGMQATHTAGPVDMAAVAKACGFPVTATVKTETELMEALPLIKETKGPVFVDIKVKAEPLPFILPTKDGVHLKNRFREKLLGPDSLL